MKLTDLRLFRYRLPLKRKLTLKSVNIEYREGFIIELADSSGNVSYGEIAPLPGFSRETMTQVEEEISRVRTSLLSHEIPPGAQRLDGGFEDWLGRLKLSPSTRFGLESAVLNLLAKSREVPLPQLLGTHPSDVKVNGLLSGTRNDVLKQAESAIESGYSCLKLKIGGLSVDNAIDLVRAARQQADASVGLRLDANRSFVLGDALTLVDTISECNIEYIEEPAQNLNQLRKLISDKGRRVGIALDESLLEINPEDLSLSFNLKAVVIKPMMLGLERAAMFAREAAANDITPVISSSFESSVGVRTLASMASAYAPDIPAGLDTINWIAEDVAEPRVLIVNGQIVPENYAGRMSIRREVLEEVALD